jgi:hypothetical protein
MDGGLIEGHELRAFGMPHPDHMITGVTGAGLEAVEESAAPLAGSSINITMHGSTLGQLNLGTVYGNIETHLHAVTGVGADEFRSAAERLIAALKDDASLAEESRAQLLGNIDYLSEEASAPLDHRRPDVIKTVLERIPQLLGAADAAKQAWDTWGPTIQAFFSK